MKKLALSALLAVFCTPIFAQQAAPTASSAERSKEATLKGLHLRLGAPIPITSQLGWRVTAPDYDHWSFIHLTPMLARFPKGQLITTYAVDPDSQKNPVYLSGFQISNDDGQHWGTRYSVLMQHIPMIFVPGERNSLLALPSEFMEQKDGDDRNFRGPYLRFEEGGTRMVMEPDGVRVIDWPWPIAVNASDQPRSNWHSGIQFTGDALRVKGQLLATTYWKRKGERVYSCGLVSSKDHGHTWHYYSTIASPADVLPEDQRTQKGFEGADETSMIGLADGRLMSVFRVGSGINWKLRRSYSSDYGHTWSKPEAIPAFSVEPKLVRTANGTIVLQRAVPALACGSPPTAKERRGKTSISSLTITVLMRMPAIASRHWTQPIRRKCGKRRPTRAGGNRAKPVAAGLRS